MHRLKPVLRTQAEAYATNLKNIAQVKYPCAYPFTMTIEYHCIVVLVTLLSTSSVSPSLKGEEGERGVFMVLEALKLC
jgi:hypothetical protein